MFKLTKKTLLGYGYNGNIRYPIWGTPGTYVEVESGSVGGTYTGYAYTIYKNQETGETVSLKHYQIAELIGQGIIPKN